jgi:hypothetical protein
MGADTPEVDDILKDMERLALPITAGAFTPLARLTHLSGRLRVIIARQEEQQMDKLLRIVDAQKSLAERLDRHTIRLIGLTRAVVMFTIVLMVLTAGLLVEGAAQIIFERHKELPQFTIQPKQEHQNNDANHHTNTQDK